ncbi:phosphatase PAP2 family protein [Spirillospora albida]|uniref:phosphatase PAP2 family protein n=1 Tax=Spirillospora albida TaxID=58123 RepID=UPI00068CE97A|nr:phosphatase PAP2 family protein [Spirillospora albida]
MRTKPGRPAPVRELVLITVLFGLYKLGRFFAAGKVADAFDNAHGIWRLERLLALPSETAVQEVLLRHETLVYAANGYYAYVHFPATAAFLLWMYLRRPTHYRWIRRLLVALTGAGLVLHVLVPLAPPRMLAMTGLIDTGARFGPAVYGAPHADSVANQYAAMPSLHIGWAAVVAFGLIASTRTRWRWLWAAHPVLTVAVVVATANHYWLDGVVVLALLSAAALLVRPPRRAAGPVGPPAALDGPRAERGGGEGSVAGSGPVAAR